MSCYFERTEEGNQQWLAWCNLSKAYRDIKYIKDFDWHADIFPDGEIETMLDIMEDAIETLKCHLKNENQF